ncbi:MAG: hypothetical protein ACRCVN_05150 [Spirochaetia bacterium]
MLAKKIHSAPLPPFLSNKNYFLCLLAIAEHHCKKQIPEKTKQKIYDLASGISYFFEDENDTTRISRENRLIKMGFLALHCNTHFTCDVGDSTEMAGIPKEIEDKNMYFDFHYVLDQWKNYMGEIVCEVKDRHGISILRSDQQTHADHCAPLCFVRSRYFKVMHIYGQ